MKGLKRTDALRLLEECLVELSEARTSSPRSAEFKHWHEGAYQLAQRIWPKVKDRSSRLARIPFRAGSSRATEEQKKEIFDRGCAEAGVLLRKWIAEIQDKGIVSSESDVDEYEAPQETPAPPPAAVAPPAGPPTLKPVVAPLAAPTPPAAEAKKPVKPKKKLKDMLGLDQLEASLGLQWKHEDSDPPPAAPAPPPSAAAPAPQPAPPPAPPVSKAPMPTPQAPSPAASAPPPPPKPAATPRPAPTAEDLGLEIVTTGPLRPRTSEEEDVPFQPPPGRSSLDAIEIDHVEEAPDAGSPTVMWSSTTPLDLGAALEGEEEVSEIVIESAAATAEAMEPGAQAFRPAADLPSFIRPEPPSIDKKPSGVHDTPSGVHKSPSGVHFIVEPEPEGLAAEVTAPPEPIAPPPIVAEVVAPLQPVAPPPVVAEVVAPLQPVAPPPIVAEVVAPPKPAITEEPASPEMPEVEAPEFSITPLDMPILPPAVEPRRVEPAPAPAAIAPQPPPVPAPPAPADEAAALMELATEIERSTLPRRRREQVIEHLATIAGQVEEGDLDWAEVEDTIVLVMKHPEIARLVVPVLSRLLNLAA